MEVDQVKKERNMPPPNIIASGTGNVLYKNDKLNTSSHLKLILQSEIN